MCVPRCGCERCDFLEHTAYVLQYPSCGSRIHLQTWTPQLYIWKEQLHRALSLSHRILSCKQFVKFVSLLVLRSTHVDSGCLLDLGVLVSGCIPLSWATACMFCLWLSLLLGYPSSLRFYISCEAVRGEMIWVNRIRNSQFWCLDLF